MLLGVCLAGFRLCSCKSLRPFRQIRLGAVAQIGKISRELEKFERTRTGLQDSAVLQTKTKQLQEAGLTLRTANRYEEPAAPVEGSKVAAERLSKRNNSKRPGISTFRVAESMGFKGEFRAWGTFQSVSCNVSRVLKRRFKCNVSLLRFIRFTFRVS